MESMGNHGDTEMQLDDSRTTLGYLINVVYRPYIEEKVKATDILSKMTCMRPFASEILSKKQINPSLAIKALLDHLKEDVTDPGKYQEFKDALLPAEYKNIYQALEGEEVKNDFEFIKIMGLFTQRIQETIDANKLAEELFSESVINEEMFQRVQTGYKTESPLDATFILLDSVHRLHPDWFHIFLRVLYRNGHRILVKDLDDKYFKELNDEPDDSESLMGNVSQTRETRAREDEDTNPTPAVNSVDRRAADVSVIPERLNSAASTEYVTVVTAMFTLKENMEELLHVVRNIDAKIDRLEGKVEHLYSKLNIPQP